MCKSTMQLDLEKLVIVYSVWISPFLHVSTTFTADLLQPCHPLTFKEGKKLYLKIKFHKTIYTFVLWKKLVFFSTCSPSFLIKGCLTTTKLISKLRMACHWENTDLKNPGSWWASFWEAGVECGRAGCQVGQWPFISFLLCDEKREKVTHRGRDSGFAD